MNHDQGDYIRGVMSGSARGVGAGIVRAALSAVEPAYSGITALRNRLYDSGAFRSTELSRPVVSVGNVTAGGTGKTPMVRWLAGRLREAGRQVAILSRGYKSAAGQLGDEQLMLDKMLNGLEADRIVIQANPDRVAGAAAALRENPAIDLFLLDDGFQHRRVARAFDLVLISATEPFGFNHVLPRGLLREPISGLRRAGAIVITHADQADRSTIGQIEECIRRYNSRAPIYKAAHRPGGLRSAAALSNRIPDRSLDDLRNMSFFAFCGIGSPQVFHRQLQALGGRYAGYRWFGDHHAYSWADLDAVRREALEKKADVLLTTEKDWVKVAQLPNAQGQHPDIWRLDVEFCFLDDGEKGLFDQVMNAVR